MVSACNDTTVSSRVTDQTKFQLWYDATKNSLDTPDLNDTTLKSLENQIIYTISCTQDKIKEKRALPNSNYTLQEQVVSLQTELNDKTDDVRTAKERAQSITNLNQKANQTESWFPLGRPLQQTSLFALIGISIFFTMMVIGLGASYFGFELNLSWVPGPPQLRGGFFGSIVSLFYMWANPLSLALLTSLIVTLSIVTWLRVKR
uniref:Uncharacterized protein n=1 Tax=viral metagenome TaxID=1070528 RepID=A0A6C0BJV0_9ZZZZ